MSFRKEQMEFLKAFRFQIISGTLADTYVLVRSVFVPHILESNRYEDAEVHMKGPSSSSPKVPGYLFEIFKKLATSC